MNEWNRRGAIAATTALIAALLIFGVALARALTFEPAPAEPGSVATEPAVPADTTTAKPLVPSAATLSSGDLALAVDHDPFQPDRTRAAPYRLPGEDMPSTSSAPSLPPAPEFTLTGLVQSDDGGLALIGLPDQTPQVVGIGESVQGYRLERIGRESATLVGDGRTVELPLTSASAQAASGRNARGGQNAEEMPFTFQGRMGGFQAIFGQAQRSGMSQEQIQQLMEQFGGRGGRGGRFEVRRDTTGGGG